MSDTFKVLVCIDLEHVATRLLVAALDACAQHASSELHVVSVSELQLPQPSVFLPGLPAPVELATVSKERVAELTTHTLQAAASTRADRLPARTEIHAMIGPPAGEIVWLAAHLDVDLIVMGTHGRRGVGRLLLGSVAEKVVRLAGCPVHVVREKAHNRAWVVPEIEPLCDACAATRATSGGTRLWCERHGTHHVRAHVYSAGDRGVAAPHAWSAATGT